MSTLDADRLEEQLQKAHLLCVRQKFDEAEALLKDLSRRYPGNAEIRYLLARIESTERVAQVESEKLRRWRYTLRLQTSWQRFAWGAGSVAGILYGGWGLLDRLPRCLREGFTALITTKVYRGSGRHVYRDPWVDWTRPLYYDVLYYGGMLLVAIIMLWVLRRVSKGASQWEELDAPLPENNRWAGW